MLMLWFIAFICRYVLIKYITQFGKSFKSYQHLEVTVHRVMNPFILNHVVLKSDRCLHGNDILYKRIARIVMKTISPLDNQNIK